VKLNFCPPNTRRRIVCQERGSPKSLLKAKRVITERKSRIKRKTDRGHPLLKEKVPKPIFLFYSPSSQEADNKIENHT
jgi:hypothetical protein